MTETVEAPAFPMTRGCPFDPPPGLMELRRENPITRVRLWDGSTPWLVTRYEDVRKILLDPRVSADRRRPGYPEVSAAAAARVEHSQTFVSMDNPEHDRYRRLLTRYFAIKRIQGLRPRIQRIVDELIEEMLTGPRPTDLVEAFALPVPSLVICELLGVPYTDRDMFHRIGKTIVSRASTPEDSVKATKELGEYLGNLAEAKLTDPGDDVFSNLAVEQLRTGRLTRREIADMGQLLLLAGHETTANMIALSTLTLLRNPEQLAEIRDTGNSAVITTAVEELLRYLSIVQAGMRRVAVEDIEIGGQVIRAGDGIIAPLDVANRDPEAFPDPDRLDIHRSAGHHVAFGYGIHQCLGQPVARMELQIVLPEVFRRLPNLRIEPGREVTFKDTSAAYGAEFMPVIW
jgi:cytochrome P450